MRNRFAPTLAACLLITAVEAFAQTAPTAPAGPVTQIPAATQTAPVTQPDAAKPTFDVASVRPSPPLDMAKLQADMQAGKMPNFGMHLNGLRAEYNYLTLRDLITLAYKVKAIQITGPDWLNTQHFDIAARMPDGSTRDDAPKMLQALLEDRFKVAVHRETQEHAVLALVVGKGGPKMKDSPGDAPPIDEEEPLKPGEMKMDTPDGPARMTMNKDRMGATMNMGKKGIITWKVNTQTMMLHVDSSKTTTTALADMLTQMMTQMGGSGGGRQVLDMTGLKGNYEVALDFSMADMVATARAQGGIGAGGGDLGGGSSTAASDPGGSGATMSSAVEKLGLKLDSRKAPVEQLIVDHAEKTPTDN